MISSSLGASRALVTDVPLSAIAVMQSFTGRDSVGDKTGIVGVMDSEVSWDDGSDASPLLTEAETCISLRSSRLLFGLKKPLRLCCPFPVVAKAALAADLVRLAAGGVYVSSLWDRLEPIGSWTSDVPWPRLVLFKATWASEFSLSVDDGFEFDVESRLLSFGAGAAVPFPALDDLRKNISLIFLRRSNSGINRPDNGNTSVVEYSRWRSPFLNIPKGFMMSRISISRPSTVTV